MIEDEALKLWIGPPTEVVTNVAVGAPPEDTNEPTLYVVSVRTVTLQTTRVAYMWRGSLRTTAASTPTVIIAEIMATKQVSFIILAIL